MSNVIQAELINNILLDAQAKIKALTNNNKVRVFALNTEKTYEETCIPKADEFVKQCCDKLGIDILLLRSKTRKQEVTSARHMIAFFLRLKYTGKISYLRMGNLIGYNDHSDFIHAFQRANDLLDVNDSIAVLYYNKINELNLLNDNEAIHHQA